MNALTAFDSKSLSEKSGLDELAQIDNDNELTKSSLARLTSNSINTLDELISEIQQMREFLKSESERVQHELGSYVQLSQRVALAASKIKADTIQPWKGTDGAGAKQPADGRQRLKRWPAPPS
jgi:Fe-S cluster assembly scaffold protein SufB